MEELARLVAGYVVQEMVRRYVADGVPVGGSLLAGGDRGCLSCRETLRLNEENDCYYWDKGRN